MSYRDYRDGQRLELDILEGKHTLNGLIQALIRRHSSTPEIKALFPDVSADLKARYNASGGLLGNEMSRYDTKTDTVKGDF